MKRLWSDPRSVFMAWEGVAWLCINPLYLSPYSSRARKTESGGCKGRTTQGADHGAQEGRSCCRYHRQTRAPNREAKGGGREATRGLPGTSQGYRGASQTRSSGGQGTDTATRQGGGRLLSLYHLYHLLVLWRQNEHFIPS